MGPHDRRDNQFPEKKSQVPDPNHQRGELYFVKPQDLSVHGKTSEVFLGGEYGEYGESVGCDWRGQGARGCCRTEGKDPEYDMDCRRQNRLTKLFLSMSEECRE